MAAGLSGKVVKRGKAFANRLALWIEHDQALLLRDAANACDRRVAFPRSGMHQLTLVHRRGEAQFVIVTARQRER